jgi:hypothetical protein
MAPQCKQMRAGACNGFAYNSVKLVLLASGYRYEVHSNTFIISGIVLYPFEILLCPNSDHIWRIIVSVVSDISTYITILQPVEFHFVFFPGISKWSPGTAVNFNNRYMINMDIFCKMESMRSIHWLQDRYSVTSWEFCHPHVHSPRFVRCSRRRLQNKSRVKYFYWSAHFVWAQLNTPTQRSASVYCTAYISFTSKRSFVPVFMTPMHAEQRTFEQERLLSVRMLWRIKCQQCGRVYGPQLGAEDGPLFNTRLVKVKRFPKKLPIAINSLVTTGDEIVRRTGLYRSFGPNRVEIWAKNDG